MELSNLVLKCEYLKLWNILKLKWLILWFKYVFEIDNLKWFIEKLNRVEINDFEIEMRYWGENDFEIEMRYWGENDFEMKSYILSRYDDFEMDLIFLKRIRYFW